MIPGTLLSDDPLTQLAKSQGIKSWPDLVSHISALPYGRNTNRHDLSLVLSQSKGTCSSKHALLKQIAIHNELNQVKLILGVYKMTEANTLGIAPVLSKHQIAFIPEAHCYLKIEGKRMDYTSLNSNINNIIPDLLEEQMIAPAQVNQYKVEYHQAFIKQYLIDHKLAYNFNQLWSIRESCISQLEQARI